jgi:tetratricopeptide (TPR) repeat protein
VFPCAGAKWETDQRIDMMKRSAGLIAGLTVAASIAAASSADDTLDCFSADNDRRIIGCTALIERRDTSMAELSAIHAMRALAYSLKGQYGTAIKDYDVAIEMQPNFAVALNNRAWAYFRWGKAETGLPDVEKSLKLAPTAAHSLDTRAHIKQVMGEPKAALRDYTQAMYFGGAEMIKLYQCGLTEAGLYQGDIDGIWRRELQNALEQCVPNKSCDPLPSDEQCRAATS